MKWVAFTITLFLGGCTWWQIPRLRPEDRDIPPMHMAVLIVIAGLWTAHLFGTDRQRQKNGSGGDDA